VETHARSVQLTELTADVSITARPFFERHGFTVEAEQHPVLDGMPLTNYKMKKKLLDSAVCLSGQLACHTQDQAKTVRDHLPLHLALTRAEPGCRSFAVTATSDPLMWQVEERFEDAAACDTHQERVASSEWGQATSDIERRYLVITTVPEMVLSPGAVVSSAVPMTPSGITTSAASTVGAGASV
jgi:quinol monooxygenase YgiN